LADTAYDADHFTQAQASARQAPLSLGLHDLVELRPKLLDGHAFPPADAYTHSDG
jgi:hypothetical protein